MLALGVVALPATLFALAWLRPLRAYTGLFCFIVSSITRLSPLSSCALVHGVVPFPPLSLFRHVPSFWGSGIRNLGGSAPSLAGSLFIFGCEFESGSPLSNLRAFEHRNKIFVYSIIIFILSISPLYWCYAHD